MELSKEEKNKKLNERIDLGLDFRNEEIDKYMKENYISKDKIRERIEEIEKIYPDDTMFAKEFLITELKGLLEE